MTYTNDDSTGEFHAFELAGWRRNAATYNTYWDRLTSQSVDPVLHAVRLQPGSRLLDVATGPGALAAAAAERGVQAIGIDFSDTMVARAQRNYSGVKFRQGDAENLEFPDESFDAVTICFGLLHFARPEQALREAYRVLKPGGRIAFTVWDTPDHAKAFGLVLDTVQRYGELPSTLPAGPPFFRFSDPAESIGALTVAGFDEAKVSPIAQTWRLPSAEAFFTAFFDGAVRTGAILRAQSDEALEAIRTALIDHVQVFEHAGALEIPMPALLAVAHKKAA